MKILMVVPSYKPAYVYGGTIVVIYMLAEELVKQGHEVHVYTTTANGSAELDVEPNVPMLVEGVWVTYFKRITGDHTHLSFRLWQKLIQNIRKFEVVHIHSWWNPLVIGAALVSKILGVRPIISPHGMLSSYIMKTNNSGVKKWLHILLGKSLLKQSFLHVTSLSEWEECLSIHPGWHGQIIPNLVKLPQGSFKKHSNDVFTIGFLSRIDPKKGLDYLVRALQNVDFKFRLLVAGEGEPEYVDSLKELAESGGIGQQVDWVGWKQGDEKFKFLSNLDLFTLTSHNENFAIVVIEALAVGTPVCITREVGLSSFVKEQDLGWITHLDVAEITQKLNDAHSNFEKLKSIGIHSPSLISDEFDSGRLAKEYAQFYGSGLI